MEQWRQPSDDDQAIRGTLGRLLFSQDDIDKKVSVLSGGEKGRMIFGKLMLRRNNILLLDEPTNHLDIEGQKWLEDYINRHQGTVLLVALGGVFWARRCHEFSNCDVANYLGIPAFIPTIQRRESREKRSPGRHPNGRLRKRKDYRPQ